MRAGGNMIDYQREDPSQTTYLPAKKEALESLAAIRLVDVPRLGSIYDLTVQSLDNSAGNSDNLLLLRLDNKC